MNIGRKNAFGATVLGVGIGIIVFGRCVFAHPMVEGGMKTGFIAVKGFAGTHLEFVADPGANELRIYVSEAEDGKLPDGSRMEWVINMTVREKKITTKGGKQETVSLLPLRDPGSGREWFPVAPVEAKDGYVFYQSNVTARVMLDADPAKRHTVVFNAGQGPNGRHCFKARLKLSEAKTIRVEEVKFSAMDATGNKEAWSKVFFQRAYGLGLLKIGKANKIAEVDMPLQAYADAIANVKSADKFRKPEAPAP